MLSSLAKANARIVYFPLKITNKIHFMARITAGARRDYFTRGLALKICVSSILYDENLIVL